MLATAFSPGSPTSSTNKFTFDVVPLGKPLPWSKIVREPISPVLEVVNVENVSLDAVDANLTIWSNFKSNPTVKLVIVSRSLPVSKWVPEVVPVISTKFDSARLYLVVASLILCLSTTWT